MEGKRAVKRKGGRVGKRRKAMESEGWEGEEEGNKCREEKEEGRNGKKAKESEG